MAKGRPGPGERVLFDEDGKAWRFKDVVERRLKLVGLTLSRDELTLLDWCARRSRSKRATLARTVLVSYLASIPQDHVKDDGDDPFPGKAQRRVRLRQHYEHDFIMPPGKNRSWEGEDEK